MFDLGFCKLLADSGDCSAQYGYGLYLYEGRGVELNYSLADEYFEM